MPGLSWQLGWFFHLGKILEISFLVRSGIEWSISGLSQLNILNFEGFSRIVPFHLPKLMFPLPDMFSNGRSNQQVAGHCFTNTESILNIHKS